MMKTFAKRFVLMAMLLMLAVCLPAFTLAEEDDDRIPVDFKITSDGYFEYKTEGLDTPELHVEKGATVTITPVYAFTPSAESTQTFEWNVFNWDEDKALGTVCTDQSYTFTFTFEGNFDFFCAFLDENQNYTYGFNNLYVTKYTPVNEKEETFTFADNQSITLWLSPENFWPEDKREYVMEKLIRDWDGDGKLTAKELNENVQIKWTADIKLGDETTYKFVDNDDYYGLSAGELIVEMEKLTKYDDGKKVVLTLTNKTGDYYKQTYILEYTGVDTDVLTVTSKDEVKIVQKEDWIEVYGPKGTTITAKDNTKYTGTESKKIEHTWTLWDHETSKETILPVKGDVCTYTFEKDASLDCGFLVQNAEEGYNEFVVYNSLIFYVQEDKYDIVVENGIPANAVTAELKAVGLDTAAKVEALAATTVYAEAVEQLGTVPAENVVVYEVELMHTTDGQNWEPVTAETWPEDMKKLTVKLPYPKGTSAANNFVVAHMFTTSTNGKTPGTFEYPSVRKYADHIEFDVTGLSPISIAWSEPAAPAVPTTGDNATPVVWLMGMLAAAGCMLLLSKRRQHN